MRTLLPPWEVPAGPDRDEYVAALLAAGFTARDFPDPPSDLSDELKYNPLQPRDRRGRWTAYGNVGARFSLTSEYANGGLAVTLRDKVSLYQDKLHDPDAQQGALQKLAKEVGGAPGMRALEDVINADMAKTEESLGHPHDPATDIHGTQGVIGQVQRAWAASSQLSPLSVALQQVVAEELGLTGVFTGFPNDRVKAQAQAFLTGEARAGLGAVVKAQYAQTQTYLERKGISQIPVYRGMWFESDATLPPGFVKDGQPHTVVARTRALAAFTTDPDRAQVFACGVDDQTNRLPVGAVVAGYVPAKRVFSVPASGLGSAFESEVVVLGGTEKLRVTTTDNTSADNRWAMFDAGVRSLASDAATMRPTPRPDPSAWTPDS